MSLALIFRCLLSPSPSTLTCRITPSLHHPHYLVYLPSYYSNKDSHLTSTKEKRVVLRYWQDLITKKKGESYSIEYNLCSQHNESILPFLFIIATTIGYTDFYCHPINLSMMHQVPTHDEVQLRKVSYTTATYKWLANRMSYLLK